MSALERDVLEFVKSRCMEIGIDASSVSSKFNLWESGILDSFSIVGLVTVIETSTGSTVDVEDFEIESFYSIDAIVNSFGQNAA